MEQVNEELIRLAQKGDELAFQELYDAYHPHVFYYAMKLCHNDADAKDIAQETFLQVYQSIHQLQRIEYFPLWLNRITYSKFQRSLAKKKETPIQNEDLYYHIDHSEQAKKQNDANLLDDEEVIRDMLQRLSYKQREVMELMYYKQYTLKEIAQQLQLPEGTVKSRYFEAKKSLKKEIERFEQLEGRRIVLHTDLLFPVFGFSLFHKLQAWLTQASASTMNGIVAASTVSMVVIGSVAVNETVHVAEQLQNPQLQEEQPLNKKAFHPVYYGQKQVDTAKSAYYTLMDWAPDANHVQKKSQEEKQMIASVIQELKASSSPYYDQLIKNGWLDAYEH